jgi:hypothetical protein
MIVITCECIYSKVYIFYITIQQFCPRIPTAILTVSHPWRRRRPALLPCSDITAPAAAPLLLLIVRSGCSSVAHHRAPHSAAQTEEEWHNGRVHIMQAVVAALLLSAAWLPASDSLSAAQGGGATCFPGFSKACCAALAAAGAAPGFKKANDGILAMIGEVEEPVFQQCAASRAPCPVRLPNGTSEAAACCTADALPGWTIGRPAQAVDALRAAGAAAAGSGSIYWVNVNQTDARKPDNVTASGVVQQNVRNQYPAWYPEACNPKAIGGQETMFCSGAGPPVLECRCTVTKQ